MLLETSRCNSNFGQKPKRYDWNNDCNEIKQTYNSSVKKGICISEHVYRQSAKRARPRGEEIRKSISANATCQHYDIDLLQMQ